MGGLIFHVGILFALILHSTFERNRNFQNLLLSLSLGPMLRLFSLSMPLYGLGYMIWFLVIAIPVFIAVVACMWFQRLDVKEVGLSLPKTHDLPLEIGVAAAGIPLGIAEY